MFQSLNMFPQLRTGTGASPEDGGCLIQVVSYLWDGSWTDETPCVHPVLRSFAIVVNDRVSDEKRQGLLRLVPRLMGTASGDERLTRQLLGWLARQVFPIYEQWRSRADYDDQGSVLACVEAAERGEPVRAAEAGRAAWAAGAAWAAEAAARAARAAWAAEAAARAAEAAATRAARAAWAAEAAALPAMLEGLCDEYDRLTGRATPVKIPADKISQLVEVWR